METLTPGKCLELGDVIGSIYYQAFVPQPYARTKDDAKEFVLRIRRHMGFPGFRFLLVRSMPEMRPVGFLYGYRSQSGQYWHDRISSVLGPVRSGRLLDGALELAEFAVHPGYQGKGYGAALYDRLLDLSHEDKAVLSTASARTPALAFYRKRGWVTIVPQMTFVQGGLPYRVMGLRRQTKGQSGKDANT